MKQQGFALVTVLLFLLLLSGLSYLSWLYYREQLANSESYIMATQREYIAFTIPAAPLAAA